MELVKGAAAGGNSGPTAPGLGYRSDYLKRGGRGGLEWLPERLSKYRFASFLSAQRMVQACLIHRKLRQAPV